MSVGFCTAVSFKEPQTVSQKLLGYVDGYLSLGCKRVTVIPGVIKDGKEAVVNDSSRSSCLFTALKIISYLTVILPLLALITKIALRCSHRFYMLDSKIDPDEVLKKVEAGKPLSNEDLKFLPLSRMNQDQIKSIFNLKVLPSELPKLRERFACIPAAEVAEAVHKRGISFGHCLLISENQCKALDITKSEDVFEAILTSAANVENLDAKSPLGDVSLENPSGMFKRVQSKIANIDPAVIETALLNCMKDNEDFCHFLTDEQIKNLKISRFDKTTIEKLINGLYLWPKRFFGPLTDETKKNDLSLVMERFALFNIDEVKLAVKNRQLKIEHILHYSSDAQFLALDFGHFSFQDFDALLKVAGKDADRSKHLIRLIPEEEVKKAINERRLEKALYNAVMKPDRSRRANPSRGN